MILGDGFSIFLGFGGINMKRKISIDKKNKPIISVICLMFISVLCFATSCSLFLVERHRPTIVSNASFLFEDANGNCYFSIPQFPGIYKYNLNVTDRPLYYENAYLSLRSESRFNPDELASNSKFLIISENSVFEENNYSKIEIFDKKMSLITSFSMNPGIWAKHMECTNDYLYFTASNLEDNTYSLKRYSFAKKDMITLLESIEGIRFYIDEDVHLFFYGDKIPFYFGKYSEKTIVHQSSQKDEQRLFTDDLDFHYSSHSIEINNNGTYLKLPFDYDFDEFYYPSYLINNKLLFACYRYQPDSKCLAKGYSTRCICGIKESHLFSFDILTNELSLIKTFKDGTYLIDYDLSNVAYYYNGGLYTNDNLVQECERIQTGESERISAFNEYRDNQSEKHYYLSYCNGQFYGI